MKKLILALTALLFSISANAMVLQEGVQYKTLSTPMTSSPTVTEYFSYMCPACFGQEPTVKAMVAQLPADVRFEKRHLSFMGGESGKLLSKAAFTAQALNRPDLNDVFFHDYHVEKSLKLPLTEAKIRDVFIKNGVSEADFNAYFNSFVINSQVVRADNDARKAELSGVPSTVVNGRYLVLLDTVKTPQDYIDIVNALLKK
ncbi:Thiol:disulfide interchange protein DsbA [Vibrio stylophorae]|uniref:Thiol:disulfide interchange protein n=1 Tax=Vibrio stylophorae TaxID=659351 RepID=A0ABM8ZPN5_9VIBR|nr:thiol:disulfide interchange protein DsbA/DsbL [Vibrio stylophorae]CAH0532215.1 Thiol:disulfide interchange protein DsbA [Vibrio stylophorae]